MRGAIVSRIAWSLLTPDREADLATLLGVFPGKTALLGVPEVYHRPPALPYSMRCRLRRQRARNAYCSGVSATTDSRPMRTRGEAAKILLALISARETALCSGFPAAISTSGFLAFAESTATTVAVPTAALRSPVS